MRVVALLLVCQLFVSGLVAQSKIDLSGRWSVELSTGQRGEIELPGTTDEARLGQESVGSDFGILTRAYKFVGQAWYERTITLPDSWDGMEVELTLERVLWQSTLYIDGREVGSRDALNSKHLYNLGRLERGEHTIRICVDNDMIHNIGDKGHPYSEYTQSIWNGIVGRIELERIEQLAFNNPKITTAIDPATLIFSDTLRNSGKSGSYIVRSELRERGCDMLLWSKEDRVSVPAGGASYSFHAQMPSGVKLWSDIDPNLYDLSVTISDKRRSYDSYRFEVGFREVAQGEGKILINGEPVMLRGNLDCIHFPLTGYPSCSVDDWVRIFRIYKSYGLNHVRCHSWTPPKAAFVAADRVGIYLQSEVVWIDVWMGEPNPRKEMDTKGYPQGLGKNPSADAFVQSELQRMVDRYGNHASFVMMCIGNELGSSDFDVMQSWIEPYKESDSRRLYSLSAARKIMPVDQFMATHYVPGVGSSRGNMIASTDWDYESVYSASPVPTIAHEIGQWPVYPRWSEIKKYTGVLKARNFEEFYLQAKDRGIEHQNESFVKGSGYLNQLMYKYEMESFLRTPSCAGIQLLSMQDYQGQGEALVGWLDVFYDSKGITTPREFRNFCDTTVALLRVEKFVWSSQELLNARIQIAHYGAADIQDRVCWRLEDTSGRVYGSGQSSLVDIKRGTSDIYTELSLDLSTFSEPKELIVKVGLLGRSIENSWRVWVYPPVDIKEGDVYLCYRYDNRCRELLAAGKRVLLLASGLGVSGSADPIAFRPLYWSYTFFPGQATNTIGMLVDNHHPIFDSFPTGEYSDWQWEAIYDGAKGFIFNSLAKEFEFIAQPIDDFHRNNRLGAIFEAKVGEGRLMVSGFNLGDNIVGNSLCQSILTYMNSSEFDPSQELDDSQLMAMFKEPEPEKSIAPSPFERALIYVDCGASDLAVDGRLWRRDYDSAQLLRESDYYLSEAAIYRKGELSAWSQSSLSVELSTPKGVIGDIHLLLRNRDSAKVVVEGRESHLKPSSSDGEWVVIHVMREDSNDGRIEIEIISESDSPLLVEKLLFIEK